MTAYRPAAPGPVVISLGTWTAPSRPDRAAKVILDPRLFTWLVNNAAKRPGLAARCALGKPALLLELV